MDYVEKRFKKSQVEDNDSNERAIEKTNKLLDDLSKNFENAAKQLYKTRQAVAKVEASKILLTQVLLKKRKQTNKRSCLKIYLQGSRKSTMMS